MISNVIVLLTPYLISAGGYNHVKVSGDGKLYRRTPSIVARARVWAKTNTAVYGRVRNAVRRIVGAKQSSNRLFSFFEVGGGYEARAATLQEELRDVYQWADSVGASLIIVYIPLAVELNFDELAGLAAVEGKELSPEVPYRMAKDIADQLSVPLFDLRPTLGAALATGKSLTCRGDPHYNGETSLACSRAIWDVMETSRGEQTCRRRREGMDAKAVAEVLSTFIRSKYDIGDGDPDFDLDVHLFDYGYIDSFGAVELTTFVEDEFGIKIADSDLVVHPLNTINQIADFIVKRRRGEI